ncbi:hypothetical protein FSP39_023277 [Pinctada imbricata]|uniref:Uncharacterized protein n=1 Tax=Pinctada imbricata TaxID=66713 RepID=A0AA89BZA8_PINIB|nr:hypothetical protein FSP39_023277 [Pinctada imbricata]
MGVVYFSFECAQSVVLFVTLGSGFLSLLLLQIERCKHSIALTLLVTTGLLHELYCVSVLSGLKELAFLHKLNTEADGCKNLYLPSLLCNLVTILVFSWSIIEHNFKNTTRDVLKSLFPFHVFLVLVIFLSSNGPRTEEIHEASYTIVPERNMSVYFTLCRINVIESFGNILAEYFFIHLPFLVLVLKAGFTSPTANGLTFNPDMTVLPSCSDDLHSCDRCKQMNNGTITVIQYFLAAMFIIRPLMAVYSFSYNNSVMDIMPSLTNTVLYSFICIEYLTSYKWTPHANTKFYLY